MMWDPDFPALPFVSDDERARWSEAQKFERHLLEIEENARLFNKRVLAGVPIGEAAKLPIPWMNRHGLSELIEMRRPRRVAPGSKGGAR
jgi:hypothetical protein